MPACRREDDVVESLTQVVVKVPALPQAPEAPSAPQAPQAPHGKRIVRADDGGVRIDNGDGTTTVIDEKGVRTINNKTGETISSVAKETGTTVPPVMPQVPMIPAEAANISYAFFLMIAAVFIGTPLARAFARRMDRKAVAPAPAQDGERLARIEQSLEAVALEVERIGEGQRYVTQLMSNRETLRVGGGNA
jgi:hypothetical protein